MSNQPDLERTATDESACQRFYQEFGITAERAAAAARDSLARVRA